MDHTQIVSGSRTTLLPASLPILHRLRGGESTAAPMSKRPNSEQEMRGPASGFEGEGGKGGGVEEEIWEVHVSTKTVMSLGWRVEG